VQASSRCGRNGGVCTGDTAIRLLNRLILRIIVPSMILVAAVGARQVCAQSVQAVLFFSPTCGHCHHVITQYLPILFQTYGGQPSVKYDQTVPQSELSLILFRNSQLEILLVDASKAVGSELYLASNRNQQIPPARSGVPRLVIGDEYLVGSAEIPERTGEIVKQGLEQGGLGWPTIDGLEEALAANPAMAPAVVAQQQDAADTVAEQQDSGAATDTEQMDSVAAPGNEMEDSAATRLEDAAPDTTPNASPSEEPIGSESPSRGDTVVEPSAEVPPTDAEEEVEAEPVAEADVDTTVSDVAETGDSAPPAPSAFDVVPRRELSMIENFQLDPVGNGFSVGVLLLMIASVLVVLLKSELLPAKWGYGFLVPMLAIIGAGIASYLAYIEATGVTAVCGPVGDCNTVNQSEYARLFGLLPIGALGFVGYMVLALVWAASRYAPESIALWSRVSLLFMAVGGTLFSIYLTFLEPFVIGATCAWCLTSSIIMTALMWLFASGGREAWVRIRSRTD